MRFAHLVLRRRIAQQQEPHSHRTLEWHLVVSCQEPQDHRGVAVAVGSISCAADNTCAVVGSIPTFYPYTYEPVVEYWNGVSWSVTLQPTINGLLTDVSCLSASFCEAVGHETASCSDGNGCPPAYAFIEQWNGTAWSEADYPNTATWYSGLVGVSCVSTEMCVALGYVDTAPQLILQWDGTNWNLVPLPAQAVEAESVSCTSSDNCCTGLQSPEQESYEQWDGSLVDGLVVPRGTTCQHILCLGHGVLSWSELGADARPAGG